MSMEIFIFPFVFSKFSLEMVYTNLHGLHREFTNSAICISMKNMMKIGKASCITKQLIFVYTNTQQKEGIIAMHFAVMYHIC